MLIMGFKDYEPRPFYKRALRFLFWFIVLFVLCLPVLLLLADLVE